MRGARCSSCDWGLTFQRPEPTDPAAILMPARFLAYCLVLAGERAADASDLLAASDAYLAALRFAGDLRLNNLLGNLIGIDVAQMALAGLGRLVSKLGPEGTSILPPLGHHLAEFAPLVLSVGEGPLVERLEMFALLEAENQQGAAAGQKGFGLLVPWRAVTAFRMSQADRLLRRAEATASIEDYEERLRLATAVGAQAARSSFLTLRTIGPSDWFRAREKAHELAEHYRMVQIAVRLEEWYGAHGQYPEDPSPLHLPFDTGTLQYQPSVERQGYRLQSSSAHRPDRSLAALVLERRPRQTSSPRAAAGGTRPKSFGK